VTHVPLCSVQGCPQNTSAEWHRCFCCGREPIEHHHVLRRSTHPDKVLDPNNMVALCPRHHQLVTEHRWSDLIYAHPNGEMHYNVKDENGEDKCDRAIGMWQETQEAAPAVVQDWPVTKEPHGLLKGKALPAVTGKPTQIAAPDPEDATYGPTSLTLLDLDADYSGLDDDALVAIYEQADAEMQGAYLIRCKVVDAYRTKHEQAWGKSWVTEARERFGRSKTTLTAQSNFWRTYIQIRSTGCTNLAEEMPRLSEQLGLIQLVGQKNEDDRPKYVEAAVALMAETGEPPTPAHVKNKLKQDVRAAQTTGPGKAMVYQRDALEFLKSLGPQSVDLLLTDPPYMTDVEDIAAFAQSWVPLALSRVKPSGRTYIFTGAYPRELHAYLSVLLGESAFTFDNILVWTYRNTLGPSPSHGYKLNWQAIFYLYGPDAPPLDCPVMLEQFTVQDVRAPDGRLGDRYHKWQKPDDLAERLIQHSTRPNELIADPFVGTGTFLAAALRLGRIAVGSETSGAMLAICEDRGIEVIRG